MIKKIMKNLITLKFTFIENKLNVRMKFDLISVIFRSKKEGKIEYYLYKKTIKF